MVRERDLGDDLDLLPATRWDDDPEESETRPDVGARLPRAARTMAVPPWPVPAPGSVIAAMAGCDLATAMEAAGALARLTARLEVAHPAVRDGWVARMRIREVTALARLEGWALHPEDLLAQDAGLSTTPPADGLVVALRMLELHRHLSRRHPRSFWTPHRLARTVAAMPAREDGRDGLPDWLATRLPGPGRLQAALDTVFDPANLARWKGAPPLLGAIDVTMTAERHGLGECLGAGLLAMLAAAWLWRQGGAAGLVLPLALGFEGHLATWRPWSAELFPGAFLAATARGAKAGVALVAALERTRARGAELLGTGAIAARRHRALDLLLAIPARPTQSIDTALGVYRQASLAILHDLAAAGLAREISGRTRYQVWDAVVA